MGDDITIGVTEIVNNIEVTAQPNDQIVDISVIDNADDVTLNITPTVIEINVNKGSSYAKWGTILGTLSDQTDLQDALDLKADLVDGKVPSYQLPSYVDDVIEVANYAALPVVGESGKIYVTIDNNHIFRWTGSTYVEITDNTAVWGAITGTLSSQSDLQSALNAKVPYTGATSNVNLGEYGLTSGYVGFDTTPTGTPSGIGTMYWDTANRTVSLIDGDGDTTLQIGQEERILVHNNTGSTLTDGQVVYVTGSTGELPSVSLANASNESTSAATIGVVTESIANGADGFITTSGLIHGLNTLAFTEGDLLWLGTTAGTYTNTKPTSPNHLVLIGYVIKRAGGNGSILVKIQNTQELEESSDVLFSGLTNNDVLTWESATSLWKNKSIATILGYTPANDSNVVHLTGNETIAGVKTFSSLSKFTNNSGSFALEIDTTSSDALVVKDGGTTKLQIGRNGEVLGAKYKVNGGFNTQFLKANGDLDSTIYTPASRILTINGTSYDLSSNRSWTIPTHDAVTIGTANGLSLVGQSLSLGLASSINTGALSSTDWNTFNGKQNVLNGFGFVKINGATISYDSTSYQPLLTNPITGSTLLSGTTGAGYVPRATASTTLTNSLIYDNGTYVGIGTTSPSQKLTIGDGTATGNQYLRINGAGSDIYIGQSVGTLLGINPNSGGLIINDNAYPLGVGTILAQPLIFGTNNTERMRITSIGTVGIGTKSPTMALQINKDYDQLKLSAASNSNYMALRSGTNYCSLSYGSSGSEALTIHHSTGNLGINTNTDAGYKLDVNGTARVSGVMSLPNMAYYADNAAALSAGLTYGDLYYDGNANVKIVINLG